MADTARLLLPTLLASQAQKHVTHNEALRMLDGLVQASILDATRTSAPVTPGEGDCHIVAAGATGAWAGWEGDLAMWTDGAWYRLAAGAGWRVWDQDSGALLVRVGASWSPLVDALGLLAQAAAVEVAVSPNGGHTGVAILEEHLTGLSGASVDTTMVIPDRAIVLGVSSRTTAAITGASSYEVGIAGETSKFGGSLSTSLGATNLGVIGPQAFYSDTPIRVTALGSDFTGGSIRLAIHYLTVGVPS